MNEIPWPYVKWKLTPSFKPVKHMPEFRHLRSIISSCWPVPTQSYLGIYIQLSLISQRFLFFFLTDWMAKGWNIAFLLQMMHPLCSTLILHFCSWFTSYFSEIIFVEAQYSILKFLVFDSQISFFFFFCTCAPHLKILEFWTDLLCKKFACLWWQLLSHTPLG